VSQFIARTPVRHSLVERIQDHIATVRRAKLRRVFERWIVHDGRFSAHFHIDQGFADQRALARAAVAHDEDVARFDPAWKIEALHFAEEPLLQRSLLLHEADAIRTVETIELCDRHQLRPFQPPPFFPLVLPRGILRDCHDEAHKEHTDERQESLEASRVCFEDDLAQIQTARWFLRNDTFPGNLGLFRPANVTPAPGGGLSFAVIAEPLGVRNLSAAAISSHANFLFGRFEATLQSTNVSGLITGFFLHRDSPRQEIDVEILGNRPDHLLVNVFYNPGTNGAKFDYGYRGTPIIIELGFDASKALHQYAIEWDPSEIRWFVDGKLVHRRAIWDPTPIPHLPMTLHVNTWPTASRELGGRLAPGRCLRQRSCAESPSTHTIRIAQVSQRRANDKS
jgi:Glycosyl hydrolases family 16